MRIETVPKLLFLLNFCSLLFCDPIGLFIPPEGWECVQSRDFPKTIQVGFLKKSSTAFKPSLNLATERVSVSFKEYLAAARRVHEQELHVEWRDLGDFLCRAGKGRLIEIRSASPCGEVKMLQAILVQDGFAYVLTGAARKEDFPLERKEILRSLRSLWVVPDLFAAIGDLNKRTILEQALDSSEENRERAWKSYCKTLLDYQDLGSYWVFLALQRGHTKFFVE